MKESMKEQMKNKIQHVEDIVYRYLPEETGYQKTVISAMHYTLKAGGKRLRPLLMEETFTLFQGKESDRACLEPFMAAIEMVHTYSLIHDDLPALDNDDYRRGRKTAHIVYGEDMAILAGDALLNYSYETAGRAFDQAPNDPRIARALQVFMRKQGIYGMIGGQVVDVETEGQPIDMDTLVFIHKNKTAALIECAMMIGAILADAKPEEIDAIEQIAGKIGMAFQIQDDILDMTSTQEELGKPVGSDEKNAKNTYVSLRGLAQARQDVEDYTREALTLYDALPYTNHFLRELLQELSGRTH